MWKVLDLTCLVVMQMDATSQSLLSRHGLVLYDPQKSPSSLESERVRTLADFEETLFKSTPVTPCFFSSRLDSSLLCKHSSQSRM